MHVKGCTTTSLSRQRFVLCISCWLTFTRRSFGGWAFSSFDNCLLLDVEGDIDWSMSEKARGIPTWVKRGKCWPSYFRLLEAGMLGYCLQQIIGHCHHLQRGPTQNRSTSIRRNVSSVHIMYIRKYYISKDLECFTLDWSYLKFLQSKESAAGKRLIGSCLEVLCPFWRVIAYTYLYAATRN